MAGKNHSTIAFIKQVGLAGMYKGLTATLMRDVPFSMIYFSLYARIKNYYRAQAQQEYLPLPKVLLSSIIAGTFAAALATPMDVIKTRLVSICFKSVVKFEINNYYYLSVNLTLAICWKLWYSGNDLYSSCQILLCQQVVVEGNTSKSSHYFTTVRYYIIVL